MNYTITPHFETVKEIEKYCQSLRVQYVKDKFFRKTIKDLSTQDLEQLYILLMYKEQARDYTDFSEKQKSFIYFDDEEV